MKRLGIALLGVILTAILHSPAGAVTVSASGSWEFGMGWAANPTFAKARQDDGREDAFGGSQRLRTQVRFVADDTLQGVLDFEIGTLFWGDNSLGDSGGRAGGGLDADGYEIKVRRAHIDWKPYDSLTLRMGIQLVALPSATFGNPVLDTRLAGVSGSYALTEKAGLGFFWLRPFARAADGSTSDKGRLQSMDMVGLTLPLTSPVARATPWGMYARNGNGSGYWEHRTGDDTHPLFSKGTLRGSSTLWWAGASLEFPILEPFALMLDGMYGQAKGGDAPEFAGYLVAGLFEYQSGAAWGNPGLLGWYASGDGSEAATKGRNGRFGRLPIVSADENGFAPTAYGFPGSLGATRDAILSDSGVGTWALGLQLAEITFAEDLTHTLRAVYMRGTNSPDMAGLDPGAHGMMNDTIYLTTKDRAVELNLLSSWAVHPNLTLHLETAYVALSFDKGVWGREKADTADAWKVQFLVTYSF